MNETRSFRCLPLKTVEQFADRAFDRLTALNARDRRAINTEKLGEIRLRPAALLAQFSNIEISHAQ